MPRGRRDRVLIASASVLALTGCSKTQPEQVCTFAEVYEYAYPAGGDSVAMLSSARLERIVGADGRERMVLIGADRDGTVRWGVLPRDASRTQLVDEASAVVPAHVAGPWFGLARNAVAADRVVVAWGEASATGEPFDIRAYGALAEGGAAAVPSTTQLLVSGLDATTTVTMGSARSGTAAALAWWPAGTGLKVGVVGGDGALLPDQPLSIDPPSDRGTFTGFGCLGFLPGIEDITLGYLDRVSSGTTRWSSAELVSDDDTHWGIPTSYDYHLATGIKTCPVFTGQPGRDGYAFAWQDQGGTWLGFGREIEVVDADPVGTVDTGRVLSATEWTGAPPSVVGVGVLSRDRYLVAFDAPEGYQIWPVTDRESAGAPRALPRKTGSLGVGGFAYQPSSDVGGDGGIGNDLWVTYADYSNSTRTQGSRYLIRVSCP